MWNILFWIFQIALILLFTFGASIYFFQDRLLYYPTIPEGSRERFFSPREFNLENCFEEVFFRTPDGIKIQSYLVTVEDKSLVKHSPTIIFFHGNAGNLSHRLPNIKGLIEKVRCNVFIVSYRGYGKSEGSPNESGIKIDAQAALDFVLSRSDLNHDKIVLFGRSLGGAAALSLAKKNASTIKAIIIENTFLSIPDMIDQVMPLLSPFKFLSTNVWDNYNEIEYVTCPILFIVGKKDQLVPPDHMEKLFKKTKSKTKVMKKFPNGEHMTVWVQPNYYETLKEFIDSVFDQ